MRSLSLLLTAALLLASRSPAAEPAVEPADKGATTPGNLKAQMLGLHGYHDRHGGFPAAFSVDGDGKPLLSWRVAILPMIGLDDLYAEFRLGEPWDSEHNKELIEKMPKIFRAPGSKADEGTTTYLGVGGPQGVVANPSVRMTQIFDGVSNTVAIVEVNDKSAVVWTKPHQWQFKPAGGLAEFADFPGDNFYAALCDGSVRLIPKATPPETLRRMFDRTDGEIIDWPPISATPR